MDEKSLFCASCLHLNDNECTKCIGTEFEELHFFIRRELNAIKIQCVREGCPKKFVMTPYEDFVKYHPVQCISKIINCPLGCGIQLT